MGTNNKKSSLKDLKRQRNDASEGVWAKVGYKRYFCIEINTKK